MHNIFVAKCKGFLRQSEHLIKTISVETSSSDELDRGYDYKSLYCTCNCVSILYLSILFLEGFIVYLCFGMDNMYFLDR